MLRTLLGIDGGGTRTRAVLLEASISPAPAPEAFAPQEAARVALCVGALSIRELGRGEAASCNHYSVGWDAAVRNLMAAATSAISNNTQPGALQIGDASLSWGLGLAGAVSPSECLEWEQRLRRALALPSGSTVRACEDVLAAQSGSFAGGPGAILIAGTGANSFGRNSLGQIARADGLGPLLGDRGSGFWIGESALRATARHHDGVASCALLHDAVLQALGAPDAPALVPIVYSPSWTKDRASALVPQVQQAAERGDQLALDILQRAGTELAHTALTVLKPLHLDEIALEGGVLEHVAPVRSSFEAALRSARPTTRIVSPRYDAAVGAALLALETN